MRLVVAPYSTPAPPKSYPWWDEVLSQLDSEIIQLGIPGEQRLECASQFIQGWPLAKIRPIIQDADGWLSVDTWLPHFCWTERLRAGVVLWSVSDPLIFGHAENLNILKDRAYLRPLQYKDWRGEAYNEDAFERPEVVVERVRQFFNLTSTRSAY